MKLFRLRRKRKSREAEKEPALDTDAEQNAGTPADDPQSESRPAPDTEAGLDAAAEAPAQAPTADAPEEAPAKPPQSQDSLLAQIHDEANSELAAEEEALQSGGGSQPEDDPLDPGLLDIFRDARNEVQESTFVADLEDVSTQELLDELASVSSRLGIAPQAPAKDAGDAVDEPSEETSDISEPADRQGSPA